MLAQVWAVRGDAPVDGPVAFVNVSDGVGVGIAVDGKLLRGAHNIAGEFGHVPLNMYGPRCSCGQRGCWEAYVSKRAVIARYRGTRPLLAELGRDRRRSRSSTSWRGPGPARPTRSRRCARRRYFLGRGFATIVKAVDPRRIYVGGEITAAWDLIAPTVREALREDALIREAGETEILIVPLGEHPRLRGRRGAHPHARVRRARRLLTWRSARRRKAAVLALVLRGRPPGGRRAPIDRHALVDRHRPVLHALRPRVAALGRERGAAPSPPT